MTTLDEIARTAVDSVRAEAERLADIEAGLDRIRAEAAGGDVGRRAVDRRRIVRIAVAAAALAFVAVGVVVARQRDGERLVPADPPPVTDGQTTVTVPVPVVAPVVTVPDESTVTTPAVPVTTEPEESVSPVAEEPPVTTKPGELDGPAPVGGPAVSYLDPPPLIEVVPFASVEVLLDETVLPHVGVTDHGGAVVVDAVARTAIVVGPDGEVREVALDEVPSHVVGGPGDVLYGLVFRSTDPTAPPMTEMVAIALSGDRAGNVVHRAEIGPGAYIDGVPLGSFGHGPTGIIELLEENRTQWLDYVDPSGAPLIEPLDVVGVAIDSRTTRRAIEVRHIDGTVTWSLDVERHPDLPDRWYDGESPPALTTEGGAIWWTGIGAPVNPGEEDPTSTVDVIAVLAPSGDVWWWQLPDGWDVAASDPWGTILARRTGDTVELARFDPFSATPAG